mgnify:CR=1 FL=1
MGIVAEGNRANGNLLLNFFAVNSWREGGVLDFVVSHANPRASKALDTSVSSNF